MTSPNAASIASTPARAEPAAPYALRSNLEQKSFDRLFESHLDSVPGRVSAEGAQARSPRPTATASPARVVAGLPREHAGAPAPVARDTEPRSSSTNAVSAMTRSEHETSWTAGSSISQSIARGTGRVTPKTPVEVRAPMSVAPERESVRVVPAAREMVEVYARTSEPLSDGQRATWFERVRMVLRSFGFKLSKAFLNGRSLEPVVRDRP